MSKRRNLEEYSYWFKKGLSNQEIAKKLGVSKQMVSQAKQKLEERAKSELVHLTKDEVLKDSNILEVKIRTVKNEVKDIISDGFLEKELEEIVDIFLKEQLLTAIVVSRQLRMGDTNPEVLKAISVFNKPIFNFLGMNQEE